MKKYLLGIMLILIIFVIIVVNFVFLKISAIDDGNAVIVGLKPSFSALNIDIEDSLTISYENINT